MTIVGVCDPTVYSRPSSVTKSASSRIASNRMSWASMTLRQVGAVASSRSAIQTDAPEFSALTVIFRVAGPVISHRRSVSPGAGGATRQVGSSRTHSVSGPKFGFSPAEMRRARSRRALSSSARRPANSPSSRATKASAAGVRIWSNRGCMVPRTVGVVPGMVMSGSFEVAG